MEERCTTSLSVLERGGERDKLLFVTIGGEWRGVEERVEGREVERKEGS